MNFIYWNDGRQTHEIDQCEILMQNWSVLLRKNYRVVSGDPFGGEVIDSFDNCDTASDFACWLRRLPHGAEIHKMATGWTYSMPATEWRPKP